MMAKYLYGLVLISAFRVNDLKFQFDRKLKQFSLI